MARSPRFIVQYCKGVGTETLDVGAGSLSFCRFSWLVAVFFRFSALFPTLRGLILESEFLRCVSVDRNLPGVGAIVSRLQPIAAVAMPPSVPAAIRAAGLYTPWRLARATAPCAPLGYLAL